MTPSRYARLLQDPRRASAWSLVREQDPSAERDAERFRAAMLYLGEEELSRQVIAGETEVAPEIAEGRGFSAILDALAEALRGDIAIHAGPAHAAVLARTHVAFLPMGSFDGFCTDRDDQGVKLDGYLIGLHDGLYFSAKLLAKALVLESLQGDLRPHQAGAAVAYEAAVAFFLRPSVGLIGGMDFDGLPADLQGALAGAQGHAAMLILQFVALHEFAHIVASDLTVRGLYRAHALASDVPAERPTRAYWSEEFRADERALRWLCDVERPAATLWMNAIVICLFFLWLDDVERRRGTALCPLHPPPAARAERLLGLMHAILPPWEDAAHRMEWAWALARSWRQVGPDPARSR